MIKYVELERKELVITRVTVEADTDEEAADKALLEAPGGPGDWEITLIQDTPIGATTTPEPGAITFD